MREQSNSATALHSRVARHFSVQPNKTHMVKMPHRRCFDKRFTEPQVGEPLAGGRLGGSPKPRTRTLKTLQSFHCGQNKGSIMG